MNHEFADRPRVLVTARDFERVERLRGEDAHVDAWVENLRERCEALLDEPPVEHELPDGLRLLSKSRAALDRVRALAAGHRLFGDDRYAERAWAELETVCAFPDWNPQHFLDVAEMAAAVGVGYDWLHGYWTAERRERLREGLLEHALETALAGYRGEEVHRGPNGERSATWWTEATHNWNTVCNGGLTVGAVALGAEGPAGVVGGVIDGAAESIEGALASLAPAGGWDEGPTYWRYNARYLAYYLSSVENGLGADLGHAGAEGVADVGDFPLYATGPTGPFDFGDADAAGRVDAPALFWFARRFDRPEWAGYQRAGVGQEGSVQDLLWYDPAVAVDPADADLPLDARFPGAEDVVAMRSSWDEDAAFVAAKGGDNQTNHGDLDLGAFAFDARGVRWAVDLGANDYNVPGYWDAGADGERWRYHRKRAEGHNCLVVDPDGSPDQDPHATAACERFVAADDSAFAVYDLGEAYGAPVRRGVALSSGREALLVQDEFEFDDPADVWWFCHTEADVSADGSRATLEQAGETLAVDLLAPSDAAFSVRPVEPLPSSPAPEAEAPVEGVRKLAVRLPRTTGATVAVRFGGEDDAEVRPLAAWSGEGPAP